MERVLFTLLTLVGVWIFTYCLYLLLSRGLSASARHQQATRYIICALCAVLPVAVGGAPGVALMPAATLSLAWMLTWPLLDLLTRRGRATEIDNKMDFAFALHLFGAQAALWYVCGWLGLPHGLTGAIMIVVQLPFLILVLFQWIYFCIYRARIDHDGLNLILNTYKEEVREFFRSLPRWMTALAVLAFVGAVGGWCVWIFVSAPAPRIGVAQGVIEAVMAVVVIVLATQGRSASWRRSGIVTLWRDNMDYVNQNKAYAAGADARRALLGDLSGHTGTGRTFVLVVGESASREYMSAFTPQPGGLDNTPWMSRMKSDPGTVLFGRAYSCHFQTVPTLTHVLTAAGQTNALTFGEAPSVVDLAHAMGMRVHWYSNQSRVGFNDTPISLMAEAADDFAWVNLTADGIGYDGALLDFLPRVRVEDGCDTLIVFHLKGSHFNYDSRYPADRALVTPEPGKKGYEAHYRNSLAYTDSVLENLYDYCKKNLNLAAIVYCSDHADIPTSRRSPVFNGVARLRIPMQVSLAADYAAAHPGLIDALREAAGHLWVNDSLYDVMAAVMYPEHFAIPEPLEHPCSLLGTLPLDGEC